MIAMHSKLKRLPRESLENMDYYEQIKFNGIYLPVREERFQKWISHNGTYQIFVPIALALFGLGNRKRVVDVGANVGLISRVFSLLYEEVIAFEPSPQNRACLSRNLSPEHNNVVIYPYALGSEEKSSWIDETLNNCGGDELIESDMITSNNVPGYKPVFVKTLDEILKEDEISALKIDVQGGDIDVLKGGVSTIQRNKPFILVETGGSDYNNASKIDKFLHNLGYSERVRIGEKDTLYLHNNHPTSRQKVVKELCNSHKALTKKFYKSNIALQELLADVDRESERIQSLFSL